MKVYKTCRCSSQEYYNVPLAKCFCRTCIGQSFVIKLKDLLRITFSMTTHIVARKISYYLGNVKKVNVKRSLLCMKIIHLLAGPLGMQLKAYIILHYFHVHKKHTCQRTPRWPHHSQDHMTLRGWIKSPNNS